MPSYTREDALALLHEYTRSESLRRHALQVEASMRAYARKYGGDEETWGIVGMSAQITETFRRIVRSCTRITKH